jgi:hypothetical protein
MTMTGCFAGRGGGFEDDCMRCDIEVRGSYSGGERVAEEWELWLQGQ